MEELEQTTDEMITLRDGKYVVSEKNVITYIHGGGVFTWEILEQLTVDFKGELIVAIGELMIDIVNKVNGIRAERDDHNRAAADAPLVELHEMVKVKAEDLGDLILDHLPRLQKL